MEIGKILWACQFGFKPGLNTIYALTAFYGFVGRCFDRKYANIAVSIEIFRLVFLDNASSGKIASLVDFFSVRYYIIFFFCNILLSVSFLLTYTDDVLLAFSNPLSPPAYRSRIGRLIYNWGHFQYEYLDATQQFFVRRNLKLNVGKCATVLLVHSLSQFMRFYWNLKVHYRSLIRIK